MDNQQVKIKNNLREFTCQIKINYTQTQTGFLLVFFLRNIPIFYENKRKNFWHGNGCRS